MKTITVILPINNPEMLNDKDLESYQTKDHFFKLSYIDTHLEELNCAEEVQQILPLVTEKIVTAERAGAAAVIVYAFGDIGISETKDKVSIPVMGLGKVACHFASLLCRNYFTIIPGQLSHNGFLTNLIQEENLAQKFIPTTNSVNLNPSEMKGHPNLLNKLMSVIDAEIRKGIDTFTLGCGGFIGIAEPLQREVKKYYKEPILIVDPITTVFNLAKAF